MLRNPLEAEREPKLSATITHVRRFLPDSKRLPRRHQSLQSPRSLMPAEDLLEWRVNDV
jgi:hypothetical protein